MEIFANIVFYFLVLIAIFSIITILFSKNTKIYLLSTIITFTSISGLYILLKSPVMFIAQITFFTLGAGAILLISTANFSPEKKLSFNLNIKTIFSLITLCLFIFLSAPFLANQIKNLIISTFCSEAIYTSSTPFANVALILFSIIIIATLSGFYTIAFWRKKWLIKWFMQQ